MYTLGIDIGSTTSKVVILEDGKNIISKAIVVAGIGTNGPEKALNIAYDKACISQSEIEYTVATGYGRKNFKLADEDISELSCHAKGCRFLFPKVRTIIDIGGQDAKVLSLNEKGKLDNFIMNDKCAAGTGRFLDVMANILQLKIEDLEGEAEKAINAVKISNTCTVFAESEVISQLALGQSIPNVVAGICESVAVRVASQVKRIGIKEQVAMSGGVAQNGGVRKALEKEINSSILYSKDAQLIGAIGAALFAYDKLNKK